MNGGGVTNEGGGHFETAGWNVANGGLDVIGDPLDKIGRIFVLNVKHLFVDFLHRHTSTEHGGDSEVATMSWIAGSHHVFGVEHLLGELGNGQGTVLLGSTGCEWGESGHEKVQSGEGDHVDSQFTQIGVQLTGESEAGGDTGHSNRNQVVKITIGGGGEFEGAEADIVQSLVIDTVSLIGILNELMNGEGSVVGLKQQINKKVA